MHSFPDTSLHLVAFRRCNWSA